MGKQRKQRLKLRSTSDTTNKQQPKEDGVLDKKQKLNFTTGNPFEAMQKDFAATKKTLQDDACSVKSSSKSSPINQKTLTKKEKQKQRKEHLLKRIDTIAQLKKEVKLKKKKKSTPIMDDMNPLGDALPSLEALIESRPSKKMARVTVKSKGTLKAKKRRKNMLQGLKVYKQILGNDEFKKNPLSAVTEHVKSVNKVS